MKLNNLIQGIICSILAGTLIYGVINVRLHHNYYRISMRPYVIQYPRRGIEIHNGYIRYTTNLTNKGKTPAYRVESYSTFTFCDIFLLLCSSSCCMNHWSPPKVLYFKVRHRLGFHIKSRSPRATDKRQNLK